MAIVLLYSLIGNSQTKFKGIAEKCVKISFQEIEEYNNLYPVFRTEGRQIQNQFETLPETPFDPNKIIYKAPKGSFSEAFRQQKDPSPAPEVDFSGLDDSGGSIPPDVNGAAGPDHLMVTLNTDVRIMDKQGNEISTVGTGAFWFPFPGSAGVFDPKIIYDHFENRWVLVMPSSGDPATTRVMIAVSETSDPTGNWFMYSFDGDPDDVHWFDYPDWGFNQKWVVVTGNMIEAQPVHAVVYVINKYDLYHYSPQVDFTRFIVEDGFSLIPAVSFDPEEEDVYMVNHAGGNVSGYGYIHLRKVTGDVLDPTIEDIGLIGVPYPWDEWSYFNNGDFAPQLGSEEKINTVDARLQNMVLRNGKLWCVHHVYLPADDPTRSSMQWWNLDLEGNILQWGRQDDETGENFCAFASIAVNAMEDVMIGYGSFSPNQYASASYSFRYANDPPNALRERYQYKDGLAPYYKTFGGNRNRWGDYTFTCVDPVNDLDFWTIQEYAEIPGSQDLWGVWWAKVNVEARPEANFSVNIQEVPVGSGADFTDLSKYEPNEWFWTFEGGTPSTSTEQNPVNIMYENEGVFDVTLIASNNIGSDTLFLENFINANTSILPEIEFVAADTVPCIGDTIILMDLTVYNPNAWLWEFSPNYVTFVNGTDETSASPHVVFDYPFTYEVTLTASNNNGSASLTKTDYIKNGGHILPFTEDFESWSFDRIGWTTVNPDDGKTWEITQAGGTEPGGLAAYVNIKAYNGLGERDRLISPPLNFYSHKNITLDFQFAYAQRFPQYTDSLIISVSTDCGINWTRLLALGEDGNGTFATVLPTTQDFIPTTPEEWCGSIGNPACVSLDLSAYTGLSNVKVCFESFNGFGNNILIDNIQIEGEISVIHEKKPELFSVYPNPVNDIVYLKTALQGPYHVSLCDLSGKVLREFSGLTGEIVPMNLGNLNKGVYMVRIKAKGYSEVHKIICY
jgi:PKD repeat protein